MKLFYTAALVLILYANQLFSQCTGGSNGGALSPAPSASYQTMNCPAGNFYYTFVVAASSCLPIYDFSFCSADGGSASFDSQITILDNTGTAVAGGYSDDYCSTQSHVVWTPSTAGTYRVRINLYNCVATTAAATLAYKMTSTYTNTAEYTVNDDAVSTGSCTTLTSASNNQRGCIWDVNSTLNFGSNFSYDFTINLGSSDAGADGMAFVMQNDARGRCACGTAGGSLGAGGISNSLVVEIDTYLNFEDRDDFVSPVIGCAGSEDPDHLDLWLNGSINPDLDANCGAVAVGERPITANAVRLQNPPGINYNIENGANHILRVSWVTGSPGTFTARVLNTALTTTFATVSSTLNPMTVFGTNSPYFGFTASTGGLSNQQTICNAALFLPVELLYFTADCNDNKTIVNWSTASETNNKSFELERSDDGINYKKIAELSGHGTSSEQHLYSFEDLTTENIIYYYRLKQLDFNDQHNYYNLIATPQNACYKLENEIIIFPNPANNQLYIKSPYESNVLVEITNHCGQIVFSTSEKLVGGSAINVETSQFAHGIYAVRIINNDKTIVRKILIEH